VRSTRPRRRAAASAAAWLAAVGLIDGCTAVPPPAEEVRTADCRATQDLAFVCGMERPEDLARVPGTRWLIASGFSPGAGLKLIDTAAKSARRWYQGVGPQVDPDRRAFPVCPGAPDPALLNAQGLHLHKTADGHSRLYVVNHGGRESVEIFDVDTHQPEPRPRWRGCVLMPAGYAANSVTTFSDGTILTTVLTRPGTTITDFVKGGVTGGVFEWVPGNPEFQLIHGTELPGNNGIEASPDDREFYVVAFGWHAVVVFARGNPSAPVRQATAPGFMPDNIHWIDDRLLLAGMQYDEPACGGRRKIVDGKADDMRCHRGYTVAELDPATMSFRLVAYGEPNPEFNGVSAGLIVGDTIWLGSYQADRVAYRPLPGLFGR